MLVEQEIIIILTLTVIAAVCAVAVALEILDRRNTRKSKKIIAVKLEQDRRVRLIDGFELSAKNIVKLSQSLSEISDIPGFFVNNNNEYILESVFVDALNLNGKDSFSNLSSRLQVTEGDAAKIVAELFKKNTVIGTLTLDGKGFVTQNSLVDEIGRQYA